MKKIETKFKCHECGVIIDCKELKEAILFELTKFLEEEDDEETK